MTFGIITFQITNKNTQMLFSFTVQLALFCVPNKYVLYEWMSALQVRDTQKVSTSIYK